MHTIRWWTAGALTATLGFAVGSWTARDITVRAASGDIQYQLHEIGVNNSLTIYSSATNTIYVYQGANTGLNTLQCSYKFQLSQPGGVIRRQNCDVHSTNP